MSLLKNIKRKHSYQLFGIALILILYAFFARRTPIYFFWESESVGWILAFLGVIFLFISQGPREGASKMVKIGRKFAVIFFSMLILGELFFPIYLPTTESGKVAIEHIKQSEIQQAKLGESIKVSFLGGASFASSKDKQSSEKAATFTVLAKGSERYAQYECSVHQTSDGKWTVKLKDDR
jgi:hypothetical protein